MSDGIVAALVAFQLELPTVGKTSQANIKPGFAYAYADLADVSAALLPALARHGIAYTAPLRYRVEVGGWVLEASLMHASGETIESQWPIPPGTPQAMGSAITYGRRYCLLAMTGVHPAGEDDDAQAAHKQLAADTVDTGGRKAQRGKAAPEEDLWATATPAQAPDTTPKAAAVRKMREDLRNTPDLATPNQLQAMHTLFALLGVDERADKLALSEAIIGHWVDSSRDLLSTEATTLVNTLRDMTRQDDPEAAVDALIEREPRQRPVEDVPLPEPT